MPSSSFFLRSSTTLVVALSFVSAPIVSASPVGQSTQGYQLDTEYSGSNFFNGMDFYTDPDPSNGFVTYAGQYDSEKKGLVSQNADGSWYIGVDSTSELDWNVKYAGVNGLGRQSVRFQSEKTWQYGLFTADIAHMPGGVCGTWPAFWTLGDGTWPYTGEIDILEGSNAVQSSLSSLHTGNTCSIAGDSRTETGTLQHTNCDYSSGANAIGCGVSGSTASFGSGFNAGSVKGSGASGGGIYAMEWKAEYISVWFFPRSSVPGDLYTDTPNPSGWGLPYANFTGGCDFSANNFQNHRIVVDNTFCGDLGDATWGQTGCSSRAATCAQFVGENPSAFTEAYWTFNSIKVFQLQNIAVPTTTTTRTTTPYSLPTSFSISTQPGVSFPPPSSSTPIPYNTPTTSSFSFPSHPTSYSIPTSFSISTQPGVSFPSPPSSTIGPYTAPTTLSTSPTFSFPSHPTSYSVPTSFSISTQPGVNFPSPPSSSPIYNTPSTSYSYPTTSSYGTPTNSFALTTGWAASAIFGFPKGGPIGPMPTGWYSAISTTAPTATGGSDPWAEWTSVTTTETKSSKSSDPTWADWTSSTTTIKTTSYDPTWAEWTSTTTITKSTKSYDPTWAEWTSTSTSTSSYDPSWVEWTSSTSADPTWAEWTSSTGTTVSFATWTKATTTTATSWAGESSWVADPTTTMPFDPTWTGGASHLGASKVAGAVVAVVGVAVLLV